MACCYGDDTFILQYVISGQAGDGTSVAGLFGSLLAARLVEGFLKN